MASSLVAAVAVVPCITRDDAGPRQTSPRSDRGKLGLTGEAADGLETLPLRARRVLLAANRSAVNIVLAMAKEFSSSR